MPAQDSSFNLTDEQYKMLKYLFYANASVSLLKLQEKFKDKSFHRSFEFLCRHEIIRTDGAASCEITTLGENVYLLALKEKRILWLKNAWIPFTVSLATTLLTNYLLPRLPQILQWFVHTLP